jgi:cyclopropane fatty-acyl-phospholipid synthase-like methyltransferase
VLARYKFVAKMFAGLEEVLEVGCGDAFATRIVAQSVGRLTASDFDPLFVAEVNQQMDPAWRFECIVHDMLAGPVDRRFDGVYALDVIEHITPTDADRFVSNIADSLTPHGVCVLGMPTVESQAYASPQSKAGHVNCMPEPKFRELMSHHFANVFIFSMNDEVVHTGFYQLAHYLLALGCAKRSP